MSPSIPRAFQPPGNQKYWQEDIGSLTASGPTRRERLEGAPSQLKLECLKACGDIDNLCAEIDIAQKDVRSPQAINRLPTIAKSITQLQRRIIHLSRLISESCLRVSDPLHGDTNPQNAFVDRFNELTKAIGHSRQSLNDLSSTIATIEMPEYMDGDLEVLHNSMNYLKMEHDWSVIHAGFERKSGSWLPNE